MPAQTALTALTAPAAIPACGAVPDARPHADAWEWVAQLDDGTLIHECENGYAVRGLASVDLARVVRFHLLPLRAGLPAPVVQVDPAAGQRVIFTRRRRLVLDPLTGAEQGRRTVHLLGFQQTVGGRNVKHLTYWFDDGSCLVSSDDQAV